MSGKKYCLQASYLLAVIILAVCIQLLCACGKEETDRAEMICVGVAVYNQSDTFLGEMVSCLKESLHDYEEKGVELTMVLRDAAGSQRKQDEQVKELIDAGCNVLCVNLVDRSTPSDIIDLARENDIPLILDRKSVV